MVTVDLVGKPIRAVGGFFSMTLDTFTVITLTGGAIMVFGYMGLPNLLFGVGHYKVTMQLPAAAGLYKNGNVTYRGTEIGRVHDVHLTDTGVEAVLSLKSDFAIPADLDAEVHSQTAIGEQYVALRPRNGDGPALKDGDVIPMDRTTIPPDINALLNATNRGLQAIPADNLHTAVDEAATAVGGLGPELSRIVKGSTALAIDAHTNLDSLTGLIDGAKPVLDSQTESADSIKAWAANLANITRQLQTEDTSVSGLLEKGPAAADEVRQLFDRVQPTVPIVLANLVSLGEVAVTYQPNLERLLVLAPSGRGSRAGGRTDQPRHQAGLQGCVLELQPQCQPAAALPHRLSTTESGSHTGLGGLSGATGRRLVLPRPAGLDVQCAWYEEPSV